MPAQPTIAIDELRRRYEALGRLEELPGERTYIGRCSTWEGFLEYGPILADAIRERKEKTVSEFAPALADLAVEAWPAVTT